MAEFLADRQKKTETHFSEQLKLMREQVHATIFGSTAAKEDKKSKILPEIVPGKMGKAPGRVRNKTQVDGFALVSQASSPDLATEKAVSKVSEKKQTGQKQRKISNLEIEDFINTKVSLRNLQISQSKKRL